MMRMMTAMTPSLNASNLPLPMRAHLPNTAQDGMSPCRRAARAGPAELERAQAGGSPAVTVRGPASVRGTWTAFGLVAD